MTMHAVFMEFWLMFMVDFGCRFHSLHHTQFRTNYSLFVPFYDYVYGTMDKSSDDLYERTLHGREEAPDVVHLTHLTAPGSLLHLRLGFASIAAAPLVSRSSSAAASVLAMVERPLAALASLLGRTAFRSEANRMGKLSTETWVVPRYTSQVSATATEQTSTLTAIPSLISSISRLKYYLFFREFIIFIDGSG